MAMQPRLDLRQSQSLVMTPQLQQAIKLLQLSNIELSAFVEQELERNPLLVREDAANDGPHEEGGAEERRDADSLLVDHTDARGEEAPLDVEVDNSYDEGSPLEGPSYDPEGTTAWSQQGGGGTFEGEGRSLEETLTSETTLRDHLSEQVALDLTCAQDRMVAFALIDSLDQAGYLHVDLDTLADGLGTTKNHVEAVVTRVQRFDPAGLFARSLSECLALQLKDRNRFDPAMEALLANLDLVAHRDFPRLLKVCNVDRDDLQEMLRELKALDPKPACRFEGAATQAITPDVLMRVHPQGGWIIEVNPETLPRVLVNNRYHAKVSQAVCSKEEKAFISENFQTASWLVKSLEQRVTTILRVASEVVRQQNGFFEKGIQALRPLILRDIAVALDMHESTISRVTSNKYIATPRGLFELKYFFTQGIASADGTDAHSAEAVRQRIRDFVHAEPPTRILSDDAIVDLLKKEGIDIARRTVAKYREGMKIPSSVQRRREKILQPDVWKF